MIETGDLTTQAGESAYLLMARPFHGRISNSPAEHPGFEVSLGRHFGGWRESERYGRQWGLHGVTLEVGNFLMAVVTM